VPHAPHPGRRGRTKGSPQLERGLPAGGYECGHGRYRRRGSRLARRLSFDCVVLGPDACPDATASKCSPTCAAKAKAVPVLILTAAMPSRTASPAWTPARTTISSSRSPSPSCSPGCGSCCAEGKTTAETVLRADDLELDLVERARDPWRSGGRPEPPRVRAAGLPAAPQDQTVTRDMLGRDVWKSRARADPTPSTPTSACSGARWRGPGQRPLIHTVRGGRLQPREGHALTSAAG